MAKIDTPQPVRGTQDMYGETQERFAHVIETFNRTARLYGFKGVEVPVIEPTAVFARSIGEATDIVSKEMYSFDDRGGDSVTLRPEFTAGIARAYLTNGWQQHGTMKLACSGPLFRYERPQKGRYRQFHQLDAEIIGASEPLADVELLAFADQLLKELGIDKGVVLTLNTLGDGDTRERWRADLVEYFEAHRAKLSNDSVDRLGRNPLRILDSKDPRDIALAAMAPSIDEYLTDEAAAFFESVTGGLDAAGIAWTRNSRLVRGLDYYRHTAFEFITNRLGAQGTVIGGGRYDGLIEQLGGPATPAVGWAAGIERLAMLAQAPEPDTIDVAIVPLGEAGERVGMALLTELRAKGIAAEMGFRGNMKKRMQRADASGARWAVVIGDDEVAAGAAGVKSLRTGEQQAVMFKDIASMIGQRLEP